MNVWLVWGLAALGAFLVIEAVQMFRGQPTLSRTVTRLSIQYPFVAALFGLVVGLLLAHFFGWTPNRWC